MVSSRHRYRIIGFFLLAILVLAIVFGFLIYSHLQSDSSGPQLQPDGTSAGYSLQTVTYCSPDQDPQLMDIYTPTTTDASHGSGMPVVEMVHGGGWTSGSKGSISTIQPVPEIPRALLGLLQQGFVVTSINYRLAPQYKFPANIEDVKCSIRFLRAHAAQYHINPNRFGIIGSSSGGHLVSLAGLAGPDAGWDVGEYTNQSSAVQAVVDMFGPEYLTSHVGNPAMSDPAIFGSDPQVLTKASPPTYISKVPNTDPPFLIVQGDKDQTVPPYHSIRFYQQLIAAGQPAMLHIIQNAGHELISIPATAAITPSATQISNGIVSFLVNHLGTTLPSVKPASFSGSLPWLVNSADASKRFTKGDL